MDRFSQVAAHLQSVRHSDSDPNGSSPNRMPASSSPATDAADAEVRKHDARIAIRSKKRKFPSTWSDGPTSSSNGDENSESTTNMLITKDEETTDSSAPTSSADAAPAAFTKDEEMPDASSPPIPTFTHTTNTIIYTIPHPTPTLTLPPNFPFRTTILGFPFFHPRPHPPRYTMASQTGYTDPRITAFIEHWTDTYEAMGEPPQGPEEGLFRLRLACHMRGLVTYGRMEALVVRLVDRAVRDAERGWTEVRDGVGRVRVVEAPMGPGVGWRFADDADESSVESEKTVM